MNVGDKFKHSFLSGYSCSIHDFTTRGYKVIQTDAKGKQTIQFYDKQDFKGDKKFWIEVLPLEEIRDSLSTCGAWNNADQLKVYTVEEFITLNDGLLSGRLMRLLRENVSKLQKYLDKNIIVPIN